MASTIIATQKLEEKAMLGCPWLYFNTTTTLMLGFSSLLCHPSYVKPLVPLDYDGDGMVNKIETARILEGLFSPNGDNA